MSRMLLTERVILILLLYILGAQLVVLRDYWWLWAWDLVIAGLRKPDGVPGIKLFAACKTSALITAFSLTSNEPTLISLSNHD